MQIQTSHQYTPYIPIHTINPIQVNTDQYIPIHTNLAIHTNTYNTYHFLYIPIQVNKYKYMQYISYIPKHTNTGQYLPTQTHTDEYLPTDTIHIFTYKNMQIQTSTYHTHQYIPLIQYRSNWSIQINEYKYIPMIEV